MGCLLSQHFLFYFFWFVLFSSYYLELLCWATFSTEGFHVCCHLVYFIIPHILLCSSVFPMFQSRVDSTKDTSANRSKKIQGKVEKRSRRVSMCRVSGVPLVILCPSTISDEDREQESEKVCVCV